VVLWKCAELLVSGAVGLAERLGVSTLVIGLTVVAMGTSAPEVAASIAAAVRGEGDIAIGNIYGSNIANLALVGGLAALIRPISVQPRLLRREMPVMLLAALLLLPVLHDLYMSRPEAILLLAVFALLIGLAVYMASKEAAQKSYPILPVPKDVTKINKPKSLKVDLLFVGVGLAGLAFGADVSIRGAVFIGQRIGLSKAVIGLTVIAVGTSLPELVTCVVAAFKGQDDISIGNLVGSNVFNTLLVAGTAGMVRPFAIDPRLGGIDYWIMVFISFAFAAIIIAGKHIISRAAGIVLLCAYVVYMAYLLAYSPNL